MITGQDTSVPAALAPRDPVSDRYAPCLTRLRELSGSLTDAERRLSGYLLTNPGKAMVCTIMELAREGGVSVSTVTRLCVKLGYTGFADMKTALAVELLTPNYHSPAPIDGQDSTSAVIGKVFALGVQSLQDTLRVLDADAIQRATEAIAACRRVECFAHGNVTGPIAEIFPHRLILIGVASVAHTHNWQANSANLLGPEDVALGLSNSGTAIPVANALQAARDAGATTICVTYAPDSPVAHVADIALITATRETHEWADSVASRLPMLTVLDVLYACVALRKQRAGTT